MQILIKLLFINMIYVSWHKIPDTDSVLSAIAFAEFLKLKWEETTPVRLWNLNNETSFLLDEIWYSAPELISSLPENTKIALVDHNEPKQSIDNISELDICYLVDHHPFGNFNTKKALYVIAEPLACTCSIIYKLFENAWFEISPKLAKLMLSAIISDTLYFRSPTTTDEDREIVSKLNEIAKIDDLEAYSLKMFDAKSDLWDISAVDLIKIDYKEFDVAWKKLWVWTIETTNPSYSLGRKDEILENMEKIKNESWLDFILLSVVDILNEKNISFVSNQTWAGIVEAVFSAKAEWWLVDLWRRISRKKEIIPQLTEYFNK